MCLPNTLLRLFSFACADEVSGGSSDSCGGGNGGAIFDDEEDGSAGGKCVRHMGEVDGDRTG